MPPSYAACAEASGRFALAAAAPLRQAAAVLLPLQALVRRAGQPRSRRLESEALLRALEEAPPDEAANAEARRLAGELRALRRRMAAVQGEVQSCRTCGVGQPPPHGAFAGGHCCGISTADAFTDDELAALRLAGTRRSDLPLPRGDHAGCAFRGERGCTLQPEHRANLCAHFRCERLRAELAVLGRAAAVEAVADELDRVYRAFIHAR